jgi:hypothetical protein
VDVTDIMVVRMPHPSARQIRRSESFVTDSEGRRRPPSAAIAQRTPFLIIIPSIPVAECEASSLKTQWTESERL